MLRAIPQGGSEYAAWLRRGLLVIRWKASIIAHVLIHALEFFMRGACTHFAYLDSKCLVLYYENFGKFNIRLCEWAFVSHLDNNLNPHTYHNSPL